ncbi:MAG: NAD(P)-dependent oxidoreductase [Candidatus Bathyarchaeia archaeon]
MVMGLMPEAISPDRTKVGWIGTGVMGKPMCGHILKAGYRVTLYNRTKAKAEELIARGAKWAGSPREVAEEADVVFTMVGYPEDVREVYLGPNGILAGAKRGSIMVDMSTSQPSLAVEIYSRAKAIGAHALDAPVSGGDIGAREATLSIMIGGDRDIAERVKPLFQLMGKSIRYMGPAGSGQSAKLCNQILIASTMIGVVECLLYAHKSGLDLMDVIAAVGSGAAGCWSINNLGPRIVRRDFDPGFMVEHFVKDMGIALEEARRMNLALPGLAMAQQFYVALKAKGKGRLGTQALALVLEELNNAKIEGAANR